MSKISLEGNVSGSGTLTIAAPNTNSNFTLSLPDNTGTIITTGSTFAGTGPAFSAYLSTNQSVTSATFTKIQLNTENFDTNNCFDNATNYRFTPNVAGYYQINGSMNGQSSTTRSRIIVSIYKNGSEYKRGSDQNYANANAANVQDVIYFNGTTDYVELYGLTTATTALFNGGQELTYFSGCFVRAA